MCFPLAKWCIEDVSFLKKKLFQLLIWPGENVFQNILNNFPKYDPMTMIARLLLLFQLFTVFPLMSYMLRTNIFTYYKHVLNVNEDFSYFKVITLNVILVTVCCLFACFLPRIGTLIRWDARLYTSRIILSHLFSRYTGALGGMIYVFTLPSLLKLATLRNDKALNPVNFTLHVSIIVIGVVNLISQFFINDKWRSCCYSGDPINRISLGTNSCK